MSYSIFNIDLTERQLEDLFHWIDNIPLSRPKRKVERDFADGVMTSEIIKHFFPNIVELHNYTPANNVQQKTTNWNVLNKKVLVRLGLNMPDNLIRDIALCKPGAAEIFLYHLRQRLEETDSDSLLPLSTDRPKHGARDGRSEYKDSSQYGDSETQSFDSRLTKTNVTRSHGGKSLNGHLKGDVVSRLEFEEKVNECLTIEENNQILSAKIRRLEHLLELKDTRIEKLTKDMEKLKSGRGQKHRF
ncbi:hypothetical protein SNEBB_008030 [Seison nebaliae]|nr:hypothetical protein SNEBB_008030 [Seison nebaliae]